MLPYGSRVIDSHCFWSHRTFGLVYGASFLYQPNNSRCLILDQHSGAFGCSVFMALVRVEFPRIFVLLENKREKNRDGN
jgi:hypothetical protein